MLFTKDYIIGRLYLLLKATRAVLVFPLAVMIYVLFGDMRATKDILWPKN